MSVSVSVKFKCTGVEGEEAVYRRGSIRLAAGTIYFSMIVSLARDLYSLKNRIGIILSYVDEDGDTVVMSSQIECEAYVRMLLEGRDLNRECPTLKLNVILQNYELSQDILPLEPPNITSQKEEVKNEPEVPLLGIVEEFYCDICDKQYKNVQEMSNHLSSYDHHYKKSFKEMKQATASDAEAARSKKYKSMFTAIGSTKRSIRGKCAINYDKYGMPVGIDGLEVITPRMVAAVKPKTSFQHTWIIRNNGPTAMNDMYLVPIGKQGMLIENLDLYVGPIDVGEASWVTVSMTSPQFMTECTLNFRLALPGGALVGPTLSIRVNPNLKSCT